MRNMFEVFACQREPELFFPAAEEGTDAFAEQAAQAIAVCARCPVREACRDFAVESGSDYGIWGGTTPAERRALRVQLLEV